MHILVDEIMHDSICMCETHVIMSFKCISTSLSFKCISTSLVICSRIIPLHLVNILGIPMY